MAIQKTSAEFGKLVLINYRFLIDEYGFSLCISRDWEYAFETSNTVVRILTEHALTLAVTIEPMGEAADNLFRQDMPINGADIAVISMCLDPNLQYRFARIADKGIAIDIAIELERRASLMKKYCEKYLKGDFSDWAVIVECYRKNVWKFYHILNG
jgi:hypothetical protein